MVTEGNGRVAVNNPLIFDGNNYRMDLEGLERIFRDEHPKMMILCNPHNPVGIQWSVEVLQEVARLAKKYGVTVVSDEIHADLMLYGKPHFPFASVSPEAAEVSITLGAPSRHSTSPGLVSSWCVVKNPKLREPFFHWLMVNEFDAPTFIATIGTEAAYTQGEDWLDEMLEYIEGTIAEVEEIVAEKLPDIKVIRPEASFLVARLPRAVHVARRAHKALCQQGSSRAQRRSDVWSRRQRIHAPQHRLSALGNTLFA